VSILSSQRRFLPGVALLTGLIVAAVLLGLDASRVSSGGAAPPAQETETTTEQFTALTYNVAGLPVGLSGSQPDVNTPLISPLLNDYDLVLVQESWINPDPPLSGLEVFHEVLVSRVTHPFLSEPAPPPLGTNPARPSALVSDGLNRMSRFPFGPITRVMWDSCHGGGPGQELGSADCLSEKGFSVARTTFAPGIEVDVYNLHAQAGGEPEPNQIRSENFEQLADFMLEHSAGRAVIVGGDFNLRRSARPVDGETFDLFLERTGLSDVCDVVDCGDDDDEVDKFLFRSGGGVAIEPLTHGFERESFQRDDGEPLSDHDPLAVTFQWTGVVTEDGDETERTSPAPPMRTPPGFTG
jgi:hypothetical protein